MSRLPPRFATSLALWLRRLLLRAANAVVPPQLVLLEESAGAARTQLLASVVRLGIADLLEERPQTSAELARRTASHPEALHRALRALAAGGLFRFDRATGRFAATAVSRALRRSAFSSMAAFAEYFATPSNLAAWADLDAVLKTGRNGFVSAHGMSVWDWFETHPAEESLFAGAMASLTELDARAIASAYPFDTLPSVLDIGGGRGALLAEILRVAPRLRGAVLERPRVVALARANFEAAGLASRGEALEGDAFLAVPAGFEGYLLKDVLHDWDDARCTKLLRCVRSSAKPGARLLVCEVLVEPNEPSVPGSFIDLQMLVALSEGRQRSRANFEVLFSASGFRLARVVQTALPISVVEGIAV